ANLCHDPAAELAVAREIEAHHPIIVAVSRIDHAMFDAHDRRRLKAGDITTPIDLLDHFAEHRRAVAAPLLRRAGLDRRAAMTEDELWLTEPRGDQLFESQR